MSENYTATWPGGSVVTFTGPGVDLLLDNGDNIDAETIAEALEAAYEAGREARDEELAQRIARSRRPKGDR